MAGMLFWDEERYFDAVPIGRRSRGEAGCRHSIIGTVGFWGGRGVVVGEGAVDAVIFAAEVDGLDEAAQGGLFLGVCPFFEDNVEDVDGLLDGGGGDGLDRLGGGGFEGGALLQDGGFLGFEFSQAFGEGGRDAVFGDGFGDVGELAVGFGEATGDILAAAILISEGGPLS